ncbi:hypothetical protein TNCV_1691801 [Trichonephila clavipes]|nr:hypothetical protein TNCV_1691801 [Trichonephila clavipes]
MLVRTSSNQHTAIYGTKAEMTLIRRHNVSPLHSPMRFSYMPLTSHTTHIWSQWNALYIVSGSELSCNSSLCHGAANYSSSFYCRRSTMHPIRTPINEIFLLNSEPVSYHDHCSQLGVLWGHNKWQLFTNKKFI